MSDETTEQHIEAQLKMINSLSNVYFSCDSIMPDSTRLYQLYTRDGHRPVNRKRQPIDQFYETLRAIEEVLQMQIRKR